MYTTDIETRLRVHVRSEMTRIVLHPRMVRIFELVASYGRSVSDTDVSSLAAEIVPFMLLASDHDGESIEVSCRHSQLLWESYGRYVEQ